MKRRPRNRRKFLRTLIVFLILGAIVNVAVAWVTAYQSMPFGWSRNGTRLDFGSHQHPIYTFVKVSSARIEVSQEFKDWPGLALDLNINGVPSIPDWLAYKPGTCSRWLGQSFADKQVRRYEEGAVGWPMFALTYWRALCGDWAGYETLTSRGAIVIAQNNGPIRVDRVLPFSPVWPGFAINTIFYAAILWGVIALPFKVRCTIRRRRGLCPACAFPVGSSPVCTECGKAVHLSNSRRKI